MMHVFDSSCRYSGTPPVRQIASHGWGALADVDGLDDVHKWITHGQFKNPEKLHLMVGAKQDKRIWGVVGCLV